jgi:hypothetical protein
MQAYNLPKTYIQEGHQAIINGKVLENEVIKAMYDGKNMSVDMYNNGQHYSTKLNKKEIDTILSMKAHPMALEKRLMRDFGVKNKTYKNKNKKKNKNKNNNKTYKKRKGKKSNKKK